MLINIKMVDFDVLYESDNGKSERKKGKILTKRMDILEESRKVRFVLVSD